MKVIKVRPTKDGNAKIENLSEMDDFLKSVEHSPKSRISMEEYIKLLNAESKHSPAAKMEMLNMLFDIEQMTDETEENNE